jgi:hypothetical protein
MRDHKLKGFLNCNDLPDFDYCNYHYSSDDNDDGV